MKTLILVLFSFSVCAQTQIYQIDTFPEEKIYIELMPGVTWETDTTFSMSYPQYELPSYDTIPVTLLTSIGDVVRLFDGYQVRVITYVYGLDYQEIPQYRHHEYLGNGKGRFNYEGLKGVGMEFIIWQSKPRDE